MKRLGRRTLARLGATALATAVLDACGVPAFTAPHQRRAARIGHLGPNLEQLGATTGFDTATGSNAMDAFHQALHEHRRAGEGC